MTETKQKTPTKDFIEKNILWVDNSNPQICKKVKVKRCFMDNSGNYHISVEVGRTVKRKPIPLRNRVNAIYWCEECNQPISALNGGFINHFRTFHPKIVQKELQVQENE